jgi:hypothetical protein
MRGSLGRDATVRIDHNADGVTAVIMLIVDLDRPTRGLIQVPVNALEDALQGMPSLAQ